MRKSLNKGGVASIVAVIIMVGIVLALIISSVIPMAEESKNTANEGVKTLGELQEKMGAD